MVKQTLALSVALAVCVGASASQELGIEKFDPTKINPKVMEQVLETSRQANTAAEAVRQSGEINWLSELGRNAVVQEAERKITRDNLAERDLDADQDKGNRKHPLGDDHRTLIFVSWSMGAATLKDLLKLYDGEPATGLVFRGIPDGVSMADAMMRMHTLTQDTQSSLPVLLDPMAFQRHGIDMVPAVAIERGDESLVAKVTGIDSISYVEDAVEEGKSGDLGTLGYPLEIAEPDMLEVAKARIDNLDYDAMKKRAISRFWNVHTGQELPTAQNSKVRRVDASVIIPADILDAQGNVITKAGRLNPLDQRAFDQKLVVIDPTQDWQVRIAKHELDATPNGITVTVMATVIAPDRGWDLFNQVQDTLDSPLYLLQPDLASRFQIERVPSVVTADATHFIVSEIGKSAAKEPNHDESM